MISIWSMYWCSSIIEKNINPTKFDHWKSVKNNRRMKIMKWLSIFFEGIYIWRKWNHRSEDSWSNHTPRLTFDYDFSIWMIRSNHLKWFRLHQHIHLSKLKLSGLCSDELFFFPDHCWMTFQTQTKLITLIENIDYSSFFLCLTNLDAHCLSRTISTNKIFMGFHPLISRSSLEMYCWYFNQQSWMNILILISLETMQDQTDTILKVCCTLS